MWWMGEDEQLKVWSQYFLNMRDHYEQAYGAFGYVEEGEHEFIDGESPWSPIDPYTGFENP
jgi:hypothetical protein